MSGFLVVLTRAPLSAALAWDATPDHLNVLLHDTQLGELSIRRACWRVDGLEAHAEMDADARQSSMDTAGAWDYISRMVDVVDPRRFRRLLAPDDAGHVREDYHPVAIVGNGLVVAQSMGQLALDLMRLRHGEASPVRKTWGKFIEVCGHPRDALRMARGAVYSSFGEADGSKLIANAADLRAMFGRIEQRVIREEKARPRRLMATANPSSPGILAW